MTERVEKKGKKRIKKEKKGEKIYSKEDLRPFCIVFLSQ
jgi:hypothetical protein